MKSRNVLAILFVSIAFFLALPRLGYAKEKFGFGIPVQANSEKTPENVLLPLPATRELRELVENAEIVLVSGYEAKTRAGATVEVEVNRPASKVLLILTSYDQVNWKVSASSTTNISGVIVSGYHAPTVVINVKAPVYSAELPYAYETENINFRRLVERLNVLFGIDRLNAFRGSYSIPAMVRISVMDAPSAALTAKGAIPKAPSKQHSFELLSTDCRKIRWQLDGPIDKEPAQYQTGKPVAFSGVGSATYSLRDGQLEILQADTRPSVVIPLPKNFPRFSWPTGMAYDARRKFVSVATLGGEGYLYRFDTVTQQWVDYRSLNNIDIFSLSYDKTKDHYVAWTDQGELLFISGNGDFLSKRKIAHLLEGFGRIYDRGNTEFPTLSVVPAGDDIVLVYIQGNAVARIWHYDSIENKAILTYADG
ncbi:MAG: hypothetical protein KGZ83_09490 [Sulfuricella sp.]|nr:hypothetical protein [Sulfuricella sp.]